MPERTDQTNDLKRLQRALLYLKVSTVLLITLQAAWIPIYVLPGAAQTWIFQQGWYSHGRHFTGLLAVILIFVGIIGCLRLLKPGEARVTKFVVFNIFLIQLVFALIVRFGDIWLRTTGTPLTMSSTLMFLANHYVHQGFDLAAIVCCPIIALRLSQICGFPFISKRRIRVAMWVGLGLWCWWIVKPYLVMWLLRLIPEEIAMNPLTMSLFDDSPIVLNHLPLIVWYSIILIGLNKATRSIHAVISGHCCPTCGYDLQGLTEPGCPECGWKRK